MSSDDSSGSVEIPVWINGSEKLMTGLTKRTTCDDVVYSLLHHEGYNPDEIEGNLSNYVIFEKWRKVERPLQGRAKISKVWKAWGPEKSHVKFAIKKVQPSAAAMIRSRRSRGPHRRRVTSEEFYDAEKVRGEKAKQQNLEDVLQLVLEQQRRLQDQINRIRETDSKIENFETDVHVNRMREKGINYLQDSYLQSLSDDSSGLEDAIPKMKVTDLEMYLKICESIIQVEEKISLENSKIDDFSFQIEEANKNDLTHRSARDIYNLQLSVTDDPLIMKEILILREKLKIAMSVGEFQRKEMESVNRNIADSEVELEKKSRFHERISREVAALDQLTASHLVSHDKSQLNVTVPVDRTLRPVESISEGKQSTAVSAIANNVLPYNFVSKSSATPLQQKQKSDIHKQWASKSQLPDSSDVPQCHQTVYPVIANRTNFVPPIGSSAPMFSGADWFNESENVAPSSKRGLSRQLSDNNDNRNTQENNKLYAFQSGYSGNKNVQYAPTKVVSNPTNQQPNHTYPTRQSGVYSVPNAGLRYSYDQTAPNYRNRVDSPVTVDNGWVRNTMPHPAIQNVQNNQQTMVNTPSLSLKSNFYQKGWSPGHYIGMQTVSSNNNNQLSHDRSRHLSLENLASHLHITTKDIDISRTDEANSPPPRVSFSDDVQEQDHVTSMYNVAVNSNRQVPPPRVEIKPIKSILKHSHNDYYYPTGLTELCTLKKDYENDSNSDTGLSSLHSDEGSPPPYRPTAPPVLETLV